MRNIHHADVERQIFEVTNDVFCTLQCISYEQWDAEKLKNLAIKWQELLNLKFSISMINARSA